MQESMPIQIVVPTPPRSSLFPNIDGDMFAPETYSSCMLPLNQAKGLPAHCYLSPEWYARELQTIFSKGWTLLGREDELPHVGSYITLDAPGVGPVFVVRSKDLRIRAFANVCRHRGARLLSEEQGRAKSVIVCPYHAWAFGLDGQLRGAPKMRSAGSRSAAVKEGACGHGDACFRKEDYPLVPVRLEQYRGFLFINGGGGEVPPLRDSLGNCPDLILEKWPLDDMVTVGRKDYIVDCNWKFLFDNTSETYHTAVVHKDSLGSMDSRPAGDHLGEAPRGDWDAVWVNTDRSVVPLPGEKAPFPEIARDTFFTNMFPTLQLNVTTDCAWWMRMLPMGPSRTRVTQGFLFPKATTELPHFEDDVKHYMYRWELAVTEDNDISLNQQHGISSAYFTPGPYNELEFATHKFDQWVVQRALGLENEEADFR